MLTRLLSLSIKTIRKRAQDMFNNSHLNCNKCDNVTVTPVSSFVSKEATRLDIIQKAYAENDIITYYFVNIFYFLYLIHFRNAPERLIFESEHSEKPFLFCF